MSESHSASFETDPLAVRTAAQWVEDTARDLGLSDNEAMRLSVIAEELFANSLHHAELNPEGVIRFGLRRDGDAIRMDYVEPARAFNPLEVDVTAVPDLDTWPIGGLGLRLIDRFANRTDYQRLGDANQVSIWLGASTPVA